MVKKKTPMLILLLPGPVFALTYVDFFWVKPAGIGVNR